MSQFAINTQIFFVTVECYKCGVVFAVSNDMQRNWRESKAAFFCPNGHSQSYIESELDRVRKQLDEQKRQSEFQKARADRLDNSLTVERKALTQARTKAARLKKRIAAGVCPCCHRTVKQLAAHMKTKHPEYAVEA